MSKSNGLSKCLTAFDQDSTLVAVVEMSQSSWLVAGIVPGIERQPLKKIEADLGEVLGLRDDQFRLSGLMVLYNNMLQSLFQSQIKTISVRASTV